MKNKGKKLEKLVMATIMAGSLAVVNNAFAAEVITDEARSYDFGGKPFMKATINRTDEDKKVEFRDLYSGEDAAISQSLNYWYEVLGTPKNVPNIDIDLSNEPNSNASGVSEDVDGSDVTRLAKCFQDTTKLEQGSPDASITINAPSENKQWYMGDLSILPRNGADNNYRATFVHEIFHALGIGISLGVEDDLYVSDLKKGLELDNSFNRYEQNFHDFNANKLTASENIALITSAEEHKEDKTFYLIKADEAAGDDYSFNGVYFRGQNVDKVLNLNGQQALIAWPNDNKMILVPGVPINGIEYLDEDETKGDKIDVDLSHFELQNSMQSHQNYRNWGVAMEVELAVLEDLGYSIDRRKLYGNSIYNSGTEDKPFEYVNTNPFYKRVSNAYIEGEPSNQSLAIGLHIYGSNVNVLQKSNLLADGEESMGIRVDGVNNKLTIDKDSKVTANGKNGRGINFAYGKDHELNVEGTVNALGAGGKALAFDFGDNMISNGKEYRGSYIRVKVGEDENKTPVVEDMLEDQSLPSLEGALVNNVNISGTVKGEGAAVYIAPNAYVKNINIKNGAQLEGAILTDWSPTGIPGIMGSYVNDEGESERLDLAEAHINLPKGEDGLTRINFAGDNLSYSGNIGSAMFESGSFVMNVNSGALNYAGTANIDSVNVAKGALLQGGTFKLDNKALHIREEISKENSGKLVNRGMISAALPNGSDTVLKIEGFVDNGNKAEGEVGTMAFIGNNGYMGKIEITGSLEGDKVLAINPNGIYLPGDNYDISSLVTVNGEKIVFDDALAFSSGIINAVYGEGYTSVSFMPNKEDLKDAEANAAMDEMSNLVAAAGKEGNTELQVKMKSLFELDNTSKTKALKSIKGEATANTSVVMQQSNLASRNIGLRLGQVNRAKAVRVSVPVKQLTEGEPISIPMDITVQPEYDMWARYSHNKGEVGDNGGDFKTNSYSIGWDKQVNKNWRFGFFGSYAKGNFEADTIYNGLEDYRLGVYGGMAKGADETMIYADYGWGKNKLSRSFTSGMGSTSAKYDSNVLEIGAEYKHDLHHNDDKIWHVKPYVNTQLSYYKQKAYAEKGDLPQNVEGMHNTYWSAEAGLELERRFANDSAYGMRIGYRRGLTGTDTKLNYHYAADTGHRYTNYGESAKNHLVLTLNGETKLQRNWSISGEAGYEKGNKGHRYSGEITLKYSW